LRPSRAKTTRHAPTLHLILVARQGPAPPTGRGAWGAARTICTRDCGSDLKMRPIRSPPPPTPLEAALLSQRPEFLPRPPPGLGPRPAPRPGVAPHHIHGAAPEVGALHRPRHDGPRRGPALRVEGGLPFRSAEGLEHAHGEPAPRGPVKQQADHLSTVGPEFCGISADHGAVSTGLPWCPSAESPPPSRTPQYTHHARIAHIPSSRHICLRSSSAGLRWSSGTRWPSRMSW